MARGRGPILILSSLLLAGGAAYIANKWIAARAAPPPATASTRILTAAMNLPLGTKLEARHVASIEVMPGQELAGTFRDPSEVEGKVTAVNVSAGQMLMVPMFAKEGESALAANVAKDKRGGTVRVDDVLGVA